MLFLMIELPPCPLRRATAILGLISFLNIAGLRGELAEPPVADGLALWLDASAQQAARQAASLPPITNQQPTDIALDTRTAGGQAMQPVAERRPQFVTSGPAAYWKFDGKDDFLSLAGPRHLTAELTVFVLAAPKSNPGDFSALFATTEAGKNDFSSGLNFDLGPKTTKDLSVLNVETGGSIGFRDLLVPGFFNAVPRPFGDFHVFTARSRIGKGGIEVFLDGFKGGDRDRLESMIGLDQMIVGARLCSNDAMQPPFAQGFFDGAIAEVLVYHRALSDEERAKVEKALLSKTVALQALASGASGHALTPVKDPPPVQILVPGFSVHELPIKTTNLNNVRYRHDGRLVGLGYDGRIHLFTDTDGDGLEDKDELFWDQQTLRGPLGIALTGKDDPRGDGIFVGSKGKVSLILDADRDGRAELEKIIATGWKEIPQNVETVGMAIDPRDGSLLFALGCVNFADPYLIDRATGRSQYDLNDIHGTVQRLSADFLKRETVCTGVRFTCALAFNREGDLFATDQEGGTWLANGNPLDELLHIQQGKHYGFPPRHPKHLPNVRDEPPVAEYGPQHQSTVGLVFNEGVNGGPSFGPATWQGNAIVCGEARGKIWRTILAKTPVGYVSQNHLIACLSLLTVDACVSPQGDLVVACHSGPPDWGTGPAGEGRIFKIRYAGRALPQPVQSWAAAPDEFRIAFDRPLNPSDWATAKEHVKIEAGPYVAAGDRFEVIRPGYQIVRDQLATPRRWINVLGLSLTEDRRTLVLRVPRQTELANYALSLPRPEAWSQPGGIPQHPEIDLLVTLNGVPAVGTAKGGVQTKVVLPHPSLAAARVFTTGSAEHDRFFTSADLPETSVSVTGLLDTANPFLPVTQPGSQRDWDVVSDPVASLPTTVQTVGSAPSGLALDDAPTANLRRLPPTTLVDRGSGLFFKVDDAPTPIAASRAFVPWVSGERANSASASAKARDDVRGNWLRGREVFSSKAGCATCHTIRGEGAALGPDLSNLIHRDRDSVLTDILQPSATINPDQTATLITLTDGTTLSGIVRSSNEQELVVALPATPNMVLARAQVASTEPMRNSLMPEGIGEQLTAAELEDLLTYLLLNPLDIAPVIRTDPPPPPARRSAEIAQVLEGVTSPPSDPQPPLRILLCGGPKDHGPDEHDYPLWLDRWARLLSLGHGVVVQTADGFPTAGQLAGADVAVFYNANPGWDAKAAALMDEFHQRGGGAVYLHYAIEGGKEPETVAERMGLACSFSKFRHGEFDLVFQSPDHPITRGFPTLHFTDETYWALRGDPSRLAILGTAIEENAPQPQLWALQRGKSRIVGCVPGHYTWTFDDPLFRILVFRSICWAANQNDVDRLADLATIGARVAD